MSTGPAVPTTGAKLTQLYVYVWDYATTTIPSDALADIQKIFGGLRSKGYQALHIQRRIAQLASIVATNRNVIAAWQAGFVGDWGEWSPTTTTTRTGPTPRRPS